MYVYSCCSEAMSRLKYVICCFKWLNQITFSLRHCLLPYQGIANRQTSNPSCTWAAISRSISSGSLSEAEDSSTALNRSFVSWYVQYISSGFALFLWWSLHHPLLGQPTIRCLLLCAELLPVRVLVDRCWALAAWNAPKLLVCCVINNIPITIDPRTSFTAMAPPIAK